MSQSQRRVGYYLAFMDPGRDSLIVVDVPPASDDHVLNGRLCNIWQVPLEDVGKFGPAICFFHPAWSNQYVQGTGSEGK